MTATFKHRTTLEWIRTEIDETLLQAQQCLEAYLQDTTKTPQIRFFLNHVHQVHGSLLMVELFGAAILLEEIELVGQAIQEDSCEQKALAIELVTQCILQVPQYLDAVLLNNREIPVLLLPLINDLRAVRKAHPLTDQTLFLSKLSTIRATFDKVDTVDFNAVETQKKLRKLRQRYQISLTSVLRREHAEEHLQRMQECCIEMEKITANSPYGQIWWIAHAVFDALELKALELTPDILQFLRSLDKSIKYIISQGATSIEMIDESLLSKVLARIHTIEIDSQAIRDIKQAYYLHQTFVKTDDPLAEKYDLSKPDRQTIEAIKVTLAQEINLIKDSLDLVVRVNSDDISDFDTLVRRLNSLGYVLLTLNQASDASTLHALAARAQQSITAKEIPERSLIDEIAALIVEVENKCKFAKQFEPSDEEMNPYYAMCEDALQVLVGLIRNDIEEIREHTLHWFDAGHDYDASVLLGKLDTISALLTFVGHEQIATSISALGQTIAQAISESMPLSWQVKDNIVDIITSADMYIEHLQNEDQDKCTFIESLATKTLAELHEQLEIKSDVDTQTPESSAGFIEQNEEQLDNNEEQAAPELELPDPEFVEVFVEEAYDVLSALKEQVPQLTADTTKEDELLKDIRRAFHTLKGSGRMVGADLMGDMAWSVENMLNQCLDGSSPFNADRLSIVRAAYKMIPDLIDAFDTQRTPEVDTQLLISQAELASEGQPLTVDIEAEIANELADTHEDESTTAQIENESVSTEAELAETVESIFYEEVIEHWQAIENQYQLGDALPDLNNLLRQWHTIKGSAHMAGATLIAETAGAIEQFFKLSSRTQQGLQPDVLSYLKELNQEFLDLIHAWHDGESLEKWNSVFAEHQVKLESFTRAVQQAASDVHHDADASSIVDLLVSAQLDGIITASNTVTEAVETQNMDLFIEVIMSLEYFLERTESMVVPEFVLALGQQLMAAYQACLDGSLHLNQSNAFVLNEANDALLDYLDAMASGQESYEKEGVVQHLEAFLLESESEAFDEIVEETPLQSVVANNESDIDDSGPQESPDEKTDEQLGASVEDISSDASEHVEQVNCDPELFEIFVEETQESLVHIDPLLKRWLDNPEDEDALLELQRIIHTLKGGARMSNIDALGELSHELEFLYEGLADGRFKYSKPLQKILLNAHDKINEMVDELISQQTVHTANYLIRLIKDYCQAPDSFSYTEHTLDVDMPEGKVVEADTPAEETVELSSEDSEPEMGDQNLNLTDFLMYEVPSQVHLDAHLDPDILRMFLIEMNESVGEIDNIVKSWFEKPNWLEYQAQLRHKVHTAKGNARLIEQALFSDFCHECETLVDYYEEGHLSAEYFFEQLMAFADRMYEWIHVIQVAIEQFVAVVKTDATDTEVEAEDEFSQSVGSKDVEPPPIKIEQPTEIEPSEVGPVDEIVPDPSLAERARNTHSILNDTEVLSQARQYSVVQAVNVRERASQSQGKVQLKTTESVRVSPEVMDTIMNLTGEISVIRGRITQQVSDIDFTLEEVDVTLERLRNQVRRLDIETEAQVLFKQEQHQGAAYQEFDPLEMDRYTKLQELARTLMESVSDLQDFKNTLVEKSQESEVILVQQGRLERELFDSLKRTRMVPFSNLISRLERIVRQDGDALGKQVELVVENPEGELDRVVLEKLTSPLEHMLRNALDHGIETVEQRRKKGKPDQGTIKISVDREGSEVVLIIQDDGAGIDVQSVKQKAVSRGIINQDTDISEHEILQLIFRSGLSTAEKITHISGRGVGMDVVNNEIKRLGGTLQIFSKVNEGTQFTIRLPFTVALNRAMFAKVGDHQFAIPIGHIENIIRVEPDKFAAMVTANEQLLYHGKAYDLQYIGHLMSPRIERQVTFEQPVPLLLVDSVEKPVAIYVDELIGSREIITKTLGAQFMNVPGIAGGAIMGDGSVVIILDIHSLVTLGSYRTETGDAEAVPLVAQQADVKAKDILVVDDSVTVRKVTSRLLERFGYKVRTAKDGVDAMSKIQEKIPGLMLLDIEMPKMDGFEVASQIRHDPKLQSIPIIMITSRGGHKHRERAKSIGIEDYFGKPYQENELLDTIKKYLSDED